MRKLLLAGAAGVGALTLATPHVSAQTTQITAPTSAAPVIRSEPGMSVRLAGRYRFYGAYAQSDGHNDTQSPGAGVVAGFPVGANNAANNAPTNNSPTGATVQGSNFDFFDYARLWFGMDGMAQNGLRYGANLEIRMGNGGGPRGSDRGTLQYRRMYGYVATPTLGQLRVGSGQVRASELMYTGHMMGTIASGLWDGDLPAAIVGPGAASLFWYSASNGNNMSAISYLSPQFFGFDAGLSFAPSNGNFGGDGSCGVQQMTTTNGGANCDRLAESNLDSQTNRPRNIWDLMLRYRGSFGPVGVVVSGGVVGADTVGATGNAQSYDNIFVGLGGTQITFAGFTVGGIITGGKANYAATTRTNQTIPMTSTSLASTPPGNPTNATTGYGTGTPLQPLPSNGNNNNLFTWQLGASYTVGPFTVGLAYHEAQYEGSLAASADAKDQGFGLGASYAVAPGMNLYAEYLWGQREESGVNLRTGQTGNINNKAVTNVFGLGVAFNW